ncbi:glycosyltransferase family 4 protein [Pedobacter jejuensis]|uniref:Glycosyltransferase family 4 protein n=1 Tax=Pedobacter jejuensis TaxID=1268550 RepID=A0A3N0BR83_9SPHI|nr:glycosyltransferase family 4 protein [Pedobacter jejuensis]RNL51132.1 glycosyltransferase family 4 protein [Pedobacter jejuensis]
MKIAIIADPELPVPPQYYGGIERIVALLIEGYIRLGHQVSLFAHPDSKTDAKLFPYSGKSSNSSLDIIKNTWIINKELIASTYDLVHNFGRLLYIFPQLPFSIPKVMSYQREPTIAQIKKATKIAKKNTLIFTGCSAYISNQIKAFAPSFAIFNGVNLDLFEFRPNVLSDAPLVFLGRIEPIKGADIAIEVAKRTKRKLIIAGNIPKEHQSYFNNMIKPHLNKCIIYIGEIDDVQKNKVLGNACALLMPVQWNEPFGIVMAEAMACGTPIIGFNKGSVPEIIINDYNGYRCDTIDEMVEATSKINNIDRKLVRKDAEERFSAPVVVAQYLKLYHQLIQQKLN